QPPSRAHAVTQPAGGGIVKSLLYRPGGGFPHTRRYTVVMALARALPLPQPQEVALQQSGVSRAEWRWLYAVAGVILSLTAFPLAIAQLVTPAGTVFSGYVVIARDAFVYQQMWQAGWAGAWLFHSGCHSETLPGVLIYPWYLWSGYLLGFLNGPALYHAARLLAATALLLA